MHIIPLLLHLISPHIAALPSLRFTDLRLAIAIHSTTAPCLAVSVLGRSLSCIAIAVRCVTHPFIAIALKSKPTLCQATATLIYSIAEIVTAVPFHGLSNLRLPSLFHGISYLFLALP